MSSLELALAAHVAELARHPRPPGSAHHRLTREYIRQHLQASGFQPRETAFTTAGLHGVNLLTLPVPDDPGRPILIVGAHYDSLPNTPGADDNASGVAALIELAR